MKIVLKKVRKRTPFAWLNPIRVEPLELEYLQTVIEGLKLECLIVDPLYKRESVHGDVVVLTGYNTARSQMMDEAREIRARAPETVIIASGVDVQVNADLYERGAFDYLMLSNRLDDFKNLIEQIVFKKNGVLYGVMSLKNKKAYVPSPKMMSFEKISPSRAYFNHIKHQTHYLLYEKVALVKRSHSCPHQCEFCFCKQLNQGHYISRGYDTLYQEMASVQADYFWVVDDVFIYNTKEAEAFINVFKDAGLKMIVYLRADFIARHSHLITTLKACGIIEVIVGFETIKASVLKEFNKGYTPDVNTAAIAALKKANLSFTALFMVDISDNLEDFKALKDYIKKQQLVNYTFSIFTPLRGTTLYETYQDDLVDVKCEHYDFLHLVLKPHNMASVVFKAAFAQLFIFQFFHSRPARQLVYRQLKRFFKGGKYE